MISPQAVIQTDGLEAFQRGIEQAGDAVTAYGKHEVRPFVSQLVDRLLRQPAGPVVYPIEWASDKQRRAFFATDGFGHGIPYVRTGHYTHSWHVRGEYGDGFGGIVVFNDADYAVYVGGQHQQPFHRNTGWIYTPDALQVIVLQTEDFIEDGLPRVLAQALEDA